MKRYNLINNSLGWLCFLIAAVTYLLTIEPTASFWDCPEFISQGFKLEVGHPPGNPIFMLAARFFVTIFGGGAETAAIAVNSMSALLSAGTILLLFWTVTHLVRKLLVKDDADDISPLQTALIMGAGICGALVYTWSDTFWFSAVEGEVYAFSSFCTALVFWLILKWENRADAPYSDRYLILIAYIIGISIAVHLLNLLCIPAIVLVFYYRKFKDTNVKGSLLALGVSVVIIALILYGLVPGFIKVAQRIELFFVNTLGCSYNTGVLVYAILLVAAFIWTIRELRLKRSAKNIRLGMLISLVLSGMPFIGHSWLIPTLLTIALVIYLFGFCKTIPVRIFNIVILSVFVIFVGYSSYALLLIRASADTPMNQNAPDNVFALGSYLNREQYGDRPLLLGPTFAEEIEWQSNYVEDPETGDIIPVRISNVDAKGYPTLKPISGMMRQDGVTVDNGEDTYTKVAKTSPDEPDRYVLEKHDYDIQYSSDMNMLFTRMYSSRPIHVSSYKTWAEYENPDFKDIPAAVRSQWAQQGFVIDQEILPYLSNLTTVNTGTDASGEDVKTDVYKADFATNLRYFINYQLNHMYWRYFMWNFAGRQNDYAGNGEPHLGNWISGIPFIDNARLGDQSLLPDEYGKDNPAHNVFYMLPLLLGIFGILWQALKYHRHAPSRGIEQFWVVFFLFFMTGIAIVLYLNQTPGQPRERDYSFAGSFYAFAIWVGMGVPAIFAALQRLFAGNVKADPPANIKALPAQQAKELQRQAHSDAIVAAEDRTPQHFKWLFAAVAIAVGIFVPLQMVSQTWDDHDRSGRYTTRDFGENYLNSLDENAIIFVNGDNDTFPLWYAQEVSGVRTDVKVVNLSYLSTDWYANQISAPSYNAKGVPMFASPADYAYDKLQYVNHSAKDFYTMLANDALSENPRWLTAVGLQPGRQTADMLLREAALVPDTVTIQTAMSDFYGHKMPGAKYLGSLYAAPFCFTYSKVIVPLDAAKIKARFGQTPPVTADGIPYMDVSASKIGSADGNFSGALSDWLSYDIVTRSAADNFSRPVYFASTVGEEYYPGFAINTFSTGMAAQVTPFERSGDNAVPSPVAKKAYLNIVGKFKWGGLDTAKPGKLYLDETVRHMVSSTRRAIISSATDIMSWGNTPAPKECRDLARKKGLKVPATYFDMAANILELMQQKLPESVCAYESFMDVRLAEAYIALGMRSQDIRYIDRGVDIARRALAHYGQMVRYATALSPDAAAKIGGTDRASVRYNIPDLTNAIVIANIAKAIIKTPSDDERLGSLSQREQLLALSKFVGDDIASEGAFYLLLSDPTDDDIRDLLNDKDLRDYTNIMMVFSDIYKTGTDKVVADALKAAGVSKAQVLKAHRI